MPPTALELVLRAHPSQSQFQALQDDNRALLEVLAQRGSLFSMQLIYFDMNQAEKSQDVPRSLLRRQIVDEASRTIVLRAIACDIMHCAIPAGRDGQITNNSKRITD